jgi:hypothetical protein
MITWLLMKAYANGFRLMKYMGISEIDGVKFLDLPYTEDKKL